MIDLSQRAGSRDSRETRTQSFDEFELRSTDGGNTLTFTGYASVFNRAYRVRDAYGTFNETIFPGAFRDSLAQGADVPFLINHGGITLARTKSGTMDLAEDSHGLHVEARLDPRQSDVRDLQIAMDRKDIDEMSFGFNVTDDEWSADWQNRSVRAVDIHKGDVSAVNYGANPFTSGAALRSVDFLRALHNSEGMSPEDIEALKTAILGLASHSSDPASEPSASETEAMGLSSLNAYRLRALNL